MQACIYSIQKFQFLIPGSKCHNTSLRFTDTCSRCKNICTEENIVSCFGTEFMMETDTQEYPEFHTYKSTFENLVEFPKAEQTSDELRELINKDLKDQEVIVGLSQIPNKKQKTVDYILKPKKKSTFSVTKKNDSSVENNPKEEMNNTIINGFDNHKDHSIEDKNDEQ